jgi:hypothetical protein
MMQAFQGVYLIELDVDTWGWGGSGFDVQTIPIFFRLDENGRPTGDKIDGGAWGPDTYSNIARTMGPWFREP